jgi:hypothetical protein
MLKGEPRKYPPKKEAGSKSYRTARRHIPEDNPLYIHCGEELKSNHIHFEGVSDVVHRPEFLKRISNVSENGSVSVLI